MVPWTQGPHRNPYVSVEIVTTDACESRSARSSPDRSRANVAVWLSVVTHTATESHDCERLF